MNITMIRVEGQGNILSGSMARRYGKEGKKEGSGTADLGNMGESSLGRNEFYFVPGKPKVPQITPTWSGFTATQI